MRRLAILVSGRGSNLQALIDAIDAGTLDARIVGVFSDKLAAPALDGPRFARLSIRSGTSVDLPRPTISPADVKTRLMRHIGRRQEAH